MVETGHRQSADVVVVEGAEERKEQKTQHHIDSLASSEITELLLQRRGLVSKAGCGSC